MNRAEAEVLLGQFGKVRAAVLGHFCLDAYWTIDPGKGEISVETGLKVRSVREQRYSLGGAGNIVNNMAGLGARSICAFGVVGDDIWAPELKRQLDKTGAETSGLLTQKENWATQVFIKPHLKGVEENRFDTADFNALLPATQAELLERFETALPKADIAVVNQQSGHALHTPKMRAELAALMARHPKTRFIADTRDFGDAYLGSMIKLNEREAKRVCAAESAEEAAESLYGKTGKPVFITRGPLGCLVRDERGLFEVPAVKIEDPIDPVGAGDSMLAGIALALGAGRDARCAAKLGNLAASVAVRKLGTTGTASPKEILACL